MILEFINALLNVMKTYVFFIPVHIPNNTELFFI